MLTLELVMREGNLDRSNAEAFMRFARNFDVLDSDSFEEAHERISISMEMLSDRMDTAYSEEEQSSLMRDAYRNL